MRYLGLIVTLLACAGTLNAQNYGELQKEYFSKGLYKVKSGNHYGIFDSKDNVVVSVEYEDILLSQDGIAVLRKNNGCVYGSVTEEGDVSYFDKVYRYHANYPFYTEGFLPVKNVKESLKEKWFFVDDRGLPLKKIVRGFLLPLTFSSVMPFNEGYASVVDSKGKVLHVDKNGQSRFVIDNDNVLFRSSVRNGETVIVTSSGVKLYQEDKETKNANVKMSISPSSSFEITIVGLIEKSLEFDDGTLFLDYLGRASKYVPKNGVPIVFDSQQKTEVLSPPSDNTGNIEWKEPEFNIEEGLAVSLKQKVVSASSKGWAGVTILLNNKSQIHSGVLKVTVKSKGITPKANVLEIASSETESIKFSLPAQFSEAQRTQEIIVEISDGERIVEKKLSVVLKRYEANIIL